MRYLRAVTFGVLALSAQWVTGATTATQWGVSALTAYADCSLYYCDASTFFFGLSTPTLTGPAAGGLNETFAQQLDVPQIHETVFAGTVDMGLASAQAQLDNANLSVPVLKAKAESYDPNGWVSGLAFGIQEYEFTGASTTTLSLNTALTGTIVNPSSSDVTGFSIGVWLLTPDTAISYPAPAVTLSEFVYGVLQSSVVADVWLPGAFVAAGSVNESPPSALTITVDPGEKFYLMAGLVASSTGAEHSADAFGTLTMSFPEGTQVVPSGVAPIPEPHTYALLLAGLALVGFAARRRRG